MKSFVIRQASFLLAVLFAFPSLLSAAECKMKITRQPCPGKAVEALKPYDGQKETVEVKELKALEACLEAAEKSAKILRKGQFSDKKVTVSFDGKELTQTFEDQRDCK